MPKLGAKDVQKELASGKLRPVYWLYGEEGMKSRELLKRIRTCALGGENGELPPMGKHLGEEILDGSEVNGSRVVESANSVPMFGSLRFVVVRDAHLMKDADEAAVLLGPARARDETGSVTVFLSKDLDGRKKFSKALVKGGAVVPCESVGDGEREAWIGYLAKRRGLSLSEEIVTQLRSLDPWTLDIIDSEMEKLELSKEVLEEPETVLQGCGPEGQGGQNFIDALFSRDMKKAMEQVDSFAGKPDEALPLLGLITWNLKQLIVLSADRERGTRSLRLSPFLMSRFNKWLPKWKTAELVGLQHVLAELDFGIKQTRLLSSGLWADLVTRACR